MQLNALPTSGKTHSKQVTVLLQKLLWKPVNSLESLSTTRRRILITSNLRTDSTTWKKLVKPKHRPTKRVNILRKIDPPTSRTPAHTGKRDRLLKSSNICTGRIRRSQTRPKVRRRMAWVFVPLTATVRCPSAAVSFWQSVLTCSWCVLRVFVCESHGYRTKTEHTEQNWQHLQKSFLM